MDEIKYNFDPFKLTKMKKPKSEDKLREVRQEIADFVLDEVLNDVGKGRSPVAKGQWERTLSESYKKLKSSESGAGFANMELTGNMLDALETRLISKDRISLIIEGEEADKADGHNNHSGRSKLPAREFIPKKGKKLRRRIVEGIREIIKEAGK